MAASPAWTTIRFPHPLYARKDATEATVHSNATTGSVPVEIFLRQRYARSLLRRNGLTGSGQSLGLLEYAGTDLADLTTYYTNAGQTNNVPVTLLSTDGTSTSCIGASGCDDTEQTLDMTQALGMAPDMSSLVMYVGSTDCGDFQFHGHSQAAERAVEFVLGVESGGPHHRRPVLRNFRSAGTKSVSGGGRQRQVATRPMSGRRMMYI